MKQIIIAAVTLLVCQAPFHAAAADGRARTPAAAAIDQVQEFSAQERVRPRIRVQPNRQPPAWDYPRPGRYSYPGPNGYRQCEGWLATEYRPSGTVITPQRRCWWVQR